LDFKINTLLLFTMVDFIRNNKKNFLTNLENSADLVIRKTRRFLPHIGRLCLISTFIEDGYRLISQWSSQIDYLSMLWSTNWIIIAIFLFVNIVCQLVGSASIICRYKVNVGCGILMFDIIFQTIGYGITNKVFIMRNLALLGSLLLLLAESNEKVKSYLAGLPNTGVNQPKQYMLLGGRLLVVLIFVSLIHWDGGFFYITQTLANLVLIIMVAVGFKTKLCAVILVTWLTVMNFWYNNFWYYIDREHLWDFLKYDFFQTWSVIGGLLLIVAYGPGGVSIDDYKKDW